MWIYAIGGEDEPGPVGAIGARGEECAIVASGAGTRSEVEDVDIVMWGSLAGAAGGIWTYGGSIWGSTSTGGYAGRGGAPGINCHFSTINVTS